MATIPATVAPLESHRFQSANPHRLQIEMQEGDGAHVISARPKPKPMTTVCVEALNLTGANHATIAPTIPE